MARWRTRTGPLRDQGRAAWQRRTRRERRLLGLGALLVLVMVLWMVGLRPALRTIEQAHEQLPLLQARTAQLDAIILDVQTLGSRRQGVLSIPETQAAMQAGLRELGLSTLSTLSEQAQPAPDAARWHVSFDNAPSAALMAWLAGLPAIAQVRIHRLDLARSNVDGRDRPGQMTGFVVLALPATQAK
ncbi:type II secretion system protein M [Alcaligenaceae bacterium CGII-47]|nr:type II secretion system protein M [Alcaligenaceae bacterium CGII-47]